MLLNLKSEFIRKNKDPIKEIMNTLHCSESTARNKINGITKFTLPEAFAIKKDHFEKDEFSIEFLFTAEERSA